MFISEYILDEAEVQLHVSYIKGIPAPVEITVSFLLIKWVVIHWTDLFNQFSCTTLSFTENYAIFIFMYILNTKNILILNKMYSNSINRILMSNQSSQ